MRNYFRRIRLGVEMLDEVGMLINLLLYKNKILKGTDYKGLPVDECKALGIRHGCRLSLFLALYKESVLKNQSYEVKLSDIESFQKLGFYKK